MGIKFRLTVLTLMISLLVVSGCSANNSTSSSVEEVEEIDHSTENHDMMEGHMDHDDIVSLNDSTGENELVIPPVLEPDDGEEAVFTVRAQKGNTEIFDGIETATYGYNGSFLGPMIRLEHGDTVNIRTINELDEETTFHWHGLEVPGEADGGP